MVAKTFTYNSVPPEQWAGVKTDHRQPLLLATWVLCTSSSPLIFLSFYRNHYNKFHITVRFETIEITILYSSLLSTCFLCSCKSTYILFRGTLISVSRCSRSSSFCNWFLLSYILALLAYSFSYILFAMLSSQLRLVRIFLFSLYNHLHHLAIALFLTKHYSHYLASSKLNIIALCLSNIYICHIIELTSSLYIVHILLTSS
jgi:hypothetical protein